MAALPILFFVAVVDRLSKAFALSHSSLVTPLFGGVMSFDPTLNSSGPLSLPLPRTLLIILTLIIGGTFLVMAATESRPLDRLFLGMVALGVLSNGYDRFAFGYVVDTLRLLDRLTFNLADVYIVAGAIALLAGYIKSRSDAKNQPAA